MMVLRTFTRMTNRIVTFLFVIMMTSCGSSGKDPQVIPEPNPGPTDNTPKHSDLAFWLTDPGQSIYFTKQKTILNFSGSSNSNPTIVVDTTQTYQTMDGFGFALTGGSAWLINQLPSQQRNDLLKELFSRDSTFIGINYLRISIGASDLDAKVFSYDDMTGTNTDSLLEHFSIAPDKENLIPVLKSIIALNPTIKILGSPWSAPAWMKTNNDTRGGSLKPQYYGVYANYLVKYIQAMQAEGIRVDAITPQNEPLNPGNNPAMTMSAVEQADFVKNFLGPAFRAAGINTKIIVYDHNCDVPSYPLTILNDAAANPYVDGSAFHLYAGNISALTQVHHAFPDKNVYFTEQWVGGPQNFPEDLKWHVKNLIIGAPRNWSKNVLEWNLASDPNYNPHTPGGCSTCLGGLTIGTSVTRNVSYYIVAHASKFVTDGSVRIASNLSGTLSNVAFKTPDGKKVLIVLNEGSAKQAFNIRFGDLIATSELAAGAVATYVW
jgi:glucosylceramidase